MLPCLRNCLNVHRGFTLAELLISLAILGVIATFTIPKILSTQEDSRFNAIAKETMGMIATAHQKYWASGQLSSTTTALDLTPYMNYVSVDTSSLIDFLQGFGTVACSSTRPCLRLHNGAVLRVTEFTYGGVTTQHAVAFTLDPDGKVTDGTTNGPGKSLAILDFYNGRVTGNSEYRCGSAWAGCVNGVPSSDPPWFSL